MSNALLVIDTFLFVVGRESIYMVVNKLNIAKARKIIRLSVAYFCNFSYLCTIEQVNDG